MSKINKYMGLSFITNAGVTFLKIFTGIIGHSSALIADGFYSATDLGTDVFAFIGSKMSRQRPDKKHPFGYGVSEYITNFIIGIVVFILGLVVAINVFSKKIVIPGTIVIWVSLIAIVLKQLMSSCLIKQGEKLKSSILITSGIESKSDADSSIVVLIASILMQFSTTIGILKYSDIIATVINGFLIMKTGLYLSKVNVSMLLGEVETDDEIKSEIVNVIKKEKRITNIENLVIIKSGPYYKIDADVLMDGNIKLKNAYNIVRKVEKNIKNKDRKLRYISIDIKPSIK